MGEVEGKYFYVCPMCGWDKKLFLELIDKDNNEKFEDAEFEYSDHVEQGCFTHACDLEQHMIDHKENGKQIVELEIRLAGDHVNKYSTWGVKLLLEKVKELKHVVFVEYAEDYHEKYLKEDELRNKKIYLDGERLYQVGIQGNEWAYRVAPKPSEERLQKFEALCNNKERYQTIDFFVAIVITKRETDIIQIQKKLESEDKLLEIKITKVQALSLQKNLISEIHYGFPQYPSSENSKLIYENDSICYIPIVFQKNKEHDKHLDGDPKQLIKELKNEVEEGDDSKSGTAEYLKIEEIFILCSENCDSCEKIIPCLKSKAKTLKLMRQQLVSYLWPVIKKLIKQCSCKNPSECISGIVGWDCNHETNCSCFKSKCLSRETALEILTDNKFDSDESSSNELSSSSSSSSSFSDTDSDDNETCFELL